MTDKSIVTTDLTRRYGYRVALKKVTLDFPVGGIHGLFGANGAGKTTLMRIIATLLRPHKGDIRVMGFDPVEEDIEVCKRIGLVGDKDLLYGELTGRENLAFYSKLYGLDNETFEKNMNELSTRFAVKSRIDDEVKILSTGLRKRLDIVRCFLHNPELLLLDEPFSGLDKDTTEVFKEYLIECRNDRTTLLTTHNLGLGAELCDSFVTLRKGEILSQGKVSEFDGVL
ncbi:MAG: ABC transporter ATP-binding protein [Candidatus Thorarchaeota archaeon]